MTIREALEAVDRLKPNQYGSADKAALAVGAGRSGVPRDPDAA